MFFVTQNQAIVGEWLIKFQTRINIFLKFVLISFTRDLEY